MRAATTLAEREAAFALVRDGWRLVDIQAAFGISRKTLYRWKKNPAPRIQGSDEEPKPPTKKKNHRYLSRAPYNSGAVAAMKAWRQDTDEHGYLVRLTMAWPLHIAPSESDAEPRLDRSLYYVEHDGYGDVADPRVVAARVAALVAREAWYERLRQIPIVCRAAV